MKDSTLGGYLREHERPPAFQGSDGHAYTVEIIVDQASAGPGTCGAYLFFLRWREGEPVGHVESAFLSEGGTAEEARSRLERLSLHEVKDILEGLLAE